MNIESIEAAAKRLHGRARRTPNAAFTGSWTALPDVECW